MFGKTSSIEEISRFTAYESMRTSSAGVYKQRSLRKQFQNIRRRGVVRAGRVSNHIATWELGMVANYRLVGFGKLFW